MPGVLGAMVANAEPDYVNLSGGNYRDSSLAPADATVTLSFQSGGNVVGGGSNVPATYAWLNIGTNSDYEIFIHNNGPATPTGVSFDTWLGLGTTRTLTLTQTGSGTLTAALDVQIRKISLGNRVFASASPSMVADAIV